MIKAIIFDWGGVLIDYPAKVLTEYCGERLGVAPSQIFEQFKLYEDEFQKGLDEKEFWRRVCANLEVKEPSSNLWEEAFRAAYKEKTSVWDLVRKLRLQGFRIGFLSNTEIPALAVFKEQNYDVFDATVFSCLDGIRKPSKKIYEITARRLGLEPSECVFVDDCMENIQGASGAGMKGLLFIEPEQFKQEILEILKENTQCSLQSQKE